MIVWRRIKYGRIAHAFQGDFSKPFCGRTFTHAGWTPCGDETGHCGTCERRAWKSEQAQQQEPKE
jgi:hypothetical protein